MARKNEFYKDVNDAWCSTIYFINPKHQIHVAAAPGVKAQIAKAYIREEKDRLIKDYINQHPNALAVDKEKYEEVN